MLARDPRRLFLRYRKKGDAAALGRVFDLVAPELLALAVHVTGDLSTAEDAVQDTFLVAVEGADRYDASRPFVPWLVGILVNRARKGRDRRRDDRVRATAEDGAPLEELAAEARRADPARATAAREIEDLVARAVTMLGEPYRSVVEQHLGECAPPRDIAIALGRAPGTVRVQLHRGLEQLRELLGIDPERSVTERLSGVGLALPAAVRLGDDLGIRMTAMRESIVQTATSTTAVGATETVGSSFTVPAIAGIAVGACALAVVLARLGAGGPDGARTIERTALARVEPAAVDEELELAPIERRSAPRAQAAASAPRRSTLVESAAPTRRSAPKRSAAAAAPEAAPAPKEEEEFTFFIEPMLDLNLVPDLVIDSRAELSARGPEGPLASTHGSLVSLTQMRVGSWASTDDAGKIVARLDHPDALPAEIVVLPQDWFPLGPDYAARPTFRLAPVLASLEVLPKRRGRRAFNGNVLLLNFHEEGVDVLDRSALARGPGKDAARLRLPHPYAAYIVFATPKDEHRSAHLVAYRGQGPGEHTLKAKLEGLDAPHTEFQFLDPYGEPLTGVEVRARLIDERIVARHGPNSVPTTVEGWAFCDDDSARREYVARISLGGREQRLPLLPARMELEGSSLGDGKVKVWGTHRGYYRYAVKTDLNDGFQEGPIDSDDPGIGRRSRPIKVMAPVAALEVGAPAEALAAPKGNEAWERTRVEVKAGERTLGVAVGPDMRASLLVPPSTPLEITATVPGVGTFTGSHPAIAFGRVGVAALELEKAEAAEEDPEEDPEEDSEEPEEDPAEAESGGADDDGERPYVPPLEDPDPPDGSVR
ncbi:MAG: RNA polymerase sigma factor [Planctomycetota bacterium]